ncbi:MAG: hypothetical protein IPF99_15470 [Deltaproteobacteria bacterium]|nr:hypothetical protein [Deltaproteobacteria bacterium]
MVSRRVRMFCPGAGVSLDRDAHAGAARCCSTATTRRAPTRRKPARARAQGAALRVTDTPRWPPGRRVPLHVVAEARHCKGETDDDGRVSPGARPTPAPPR